MTNPPIPPEDLARDLEALLVSDVGPEEFTRRLFALDYARTYAADPAVAWTMRACAIPRSFDAAIIAVLRDAPDEHEENARLLAGLLPFSFVLAHKDGGYVYHDIIRDLLLAEWMGEGNRGEFEEIRGRLADFYWRRGEDFFDKKEYEAALADFSRAVELQPDDRMSYLGLGKSQYFLKDYQAALESFHCVIALQPEDGSNYLWRGASQFWLRDYTAALSDFRRAVELQPENGNNYHWRGLTYYEQRDYTAALADFNRAIELQPGNENNYYRRGWTYYEQRDYSAALADFSQAIELQPGNENNYYGRGWTYYEQRDYTAALADFSQAIELQPEEGDNYYGRGRTYYEQRDYTAALADFNQAIELQPENGNNYYWRGRTYYEQRDYTAALADFSQAIELQPEDRDNYLWREMIDQVLRGDSVVERPRQMSNTQYVAPRTPVEQQIVQIWQELLGIEQIGVYDNFFELGGHSLLMAQVFSRVRGAFNVELPLRTFFAEPTVAELAERIATQLEEGVGAMIRGPSEDH